MILPRQTFRSPPSSTALLLSLALFCAAALPGCTLEQGQSVADDVAGALDEFFGDLSGAVEPERGNGDEQFKQGMAYLTGEGVERDPQKAAVLLTEAAELGNANAQFVLGAAILSDDPDPEVREEAVRWLQAAAAQNHVKATKLLGDLYASGKGVEKDEAWAARWYGRAALMGDADAQFEVASRFLLARGLTKDPARAYAWMKTAASGGQAKAKDYAEALAQALPPDQRKKAEGLAAAYRPHTPPRYSDEFTIRWLQTALAKKGYSPGPSDGIAGDKTRRALGAFARDQGIEAIEPNAEVIAALRA